MQVPYQVLMYDERLIYFEINENDIISIIKNVNASKVPG